MDICNFYAFGSKLYMTTFSAAPIDKATTIESAICWKLIAGNYENIKFPLIFNYIHGKYLRDIMDTGYPYLFLISEKLKTVLEKNQLTGWKTFPVKVYDKQNKLVPGYYGLTITGRCGPIDYSKGETYKKKYVEHGPTVKVHKGEYIGLDKWDGSDFFLPQGAYKIRINQKAAKILKENKLTNICLEKISEIEYSDYDIKVFKKNQKKAIANFPMNVDK